MSFTAASTSRASTPRLVVSLGATLSAPTTESCTRTFVSIVFSVSFDRLTLLDAMSPASPIERSKFASLSRFSSRSSVADTFWRSASLSCDARTRAPAVLAALRIRSRDSGTLAAAICIVWVSRGATAAVARSCTVKPRFAVVTLLTSGFSLTASFITSPAFFSSAEMASASLAGTSNPS